jgi:DNA-binding response OmpR family regulator
LYTLWKPQVILLDLGLPDLHGLECLKNFKDNKSISPGICIISGFGELDMKLACFKSGGDDFLCKPFSNQELLARVLALFRRNNYQHSEDITHKGLCLLPKSNKLHHLGKSLRLTTKEMSLLTYLLQRSGEVASRGELIDTVWEGGDRYPNVVDVTIDHLRSKLKSISVPHCIHTAYGKGYYFEMDSEEIMNNSTE